MRANRRLKPNHNMRARKTLKPRWAMRASSILNPNYAMRASRTLEPMKQMRAISNMKPRVLMRNHQPKRRSKMQFKIEELKKQYDGKSIVECVTEAKTLNEGMIKQGEELVGLLWYLEKTKRFHDYEGYAKIAFKVFVFEICHIPYNRYRQLAYAYNWYPVESREYGPQTIQAIRSSVGVVKIPKVLGEIKKKVSNITAPDKRREAIAEVIKKYTPPKKVVPATDTKSYWKRKYEELFDKYKLLEKENGEMREQLSRQRVPLENLQKVRDIVQVAVQ